MPGYKPGDKVEIETVDGKYTGILMERPELADDKHVVIKLESGYNVGISLDRIREIKKIEARIKRERFRLKRHKRDPSKRDISILATGGTIASRVDYITGGVHSAFSAEELISAVPELEEIANIQGRQIFNKFSENIIPEDWIKIARTTASEIKKGVDGIVITHGTDTMGYTSAALAFMLKTPVPVVLTGAQRSSDRGSSDAPLNLIHSAIVASKADLSEVVVVMHGEISDSFSLIHPGTRVRKLHTSRRDAFRTVNSRPLGRVSMKGIEFLREPKSDNKLKLDTKLEERVFLLKYFPGLNPEVIDNLVELGYNGIVIEGTGLGHTSELLFERIKDAIDSGVFIAMTSQTIFGRVNMNVYSTGRILQDIGVIPCEDMLSETAYVKLMWCLGHTKKPERLREMMLTNYAGEITERSRIE
ncbi:MAG: Glu-tRNA(Gln) amidotransferase GatDE subunit D [Candidatus Altiarchaeales archaeon]|nr:MAG: Glu-tRNA(Gln) amidotransferase GatDE subunit D [Candidatus Altiarchaeales archaeon]